MFFSGYHDDTFFPRPSSMRVRMKMKFILHISTCGGWKMSRWPNFWLNIVQACERICEKDKMNKIRYSHSVSMHNLFNKIEKLRTWKSLRHFYEFYKKLYILDFDGTVKYQLLCVSRDGKCRSIPFRLHLPSARLPII